MTLLYVFIYEKLHVHVFSKTLLGGGGGVYTKFLKIFWRRIHFDVNIIMVI